MQENVVSYILIDSDMKNNIIKSRPESDHPKVPKYDVMKMTQKLA